MSVISKTGGEPVRHIARARLPWRNERTTQCGRGENDVQEILSFDDARKLIAQLGKQRAAMVLCMTCVETTQRHAPSWDADPIGVWSRELSAASWSRSPNNEMTKRELLAIAALVAAHRDEFDGMLSGLEDVTTLDQRRTKRARR